MVQVPTVRKVAVAGEAAPDKVQTLGVSEPRLTVKPELAVAASNSGLPTVAVPDGANVIICGVCPTATVRAAAGLVTPFKLAVILVEPVAIPVAKPATLIVAIAAVPEFQVTDAVTSDIVPSL
jgi:hypothetical protein